jgi:hypothetical protein
MLERCARRETAAGFFMPTTVDTKRYTMTPREKTDLVIGFFLICIPGMVFAAFAGGVIAMIAMALS